MASDQEREDVRRLLLDAAAQFHENIVRTFTVVDRVGTFVAPDSSRTIFLPPRITAFVKLRLTTDIAVPPTGTNWVSDSDYYEYDEFTGKFIFQDNVAYPSPPDVGDLVNLIAISENGIDDPTVDLHVAFAKAYVNKWTNGNFSFTKSETDIDEMLSYFAAMYVASWGLILSASGVNVLMEGINYRLGDLEVQTKTWGEGMIAQPLFNLFKNQILQIMSLLRTEPIWFTGAIDRSYDSDYKSAIKRHWPLENYV